VNPSGANGLLMGGGATLLLKQAAGIGVALGVAGVSTLLIAMVLRFTIGLRVGHEEEDAGLDLSEHGESAYAGPATGSEDIVVASTADAAPADA